MKSPITSYDTLCLPWENIKKAVPKALDAISSPKGDLMLVMTKDEILIFINPKESLKEPASKILLNKDEIMVSNQWTTDSYLEKWDTELSKVFKVKN